MDRKKSGITDAMMENAIRNYKEKYLSGFPKYSNNTDSYSDPKPPKNNYSAPLLDSNQHSFTYVNSDPNNSENNPFTNVDSDYNKPEKKYYTYTDAYRYSFTNENSANPNKNSGYFVYVESPLLWDEVTQTYRRNPKCTIPNCEKMDWQKFML